MGNKSTCPREGGGKSINECLGMSSTCQDVDLLLLIYLNEKRLGNTNHRFQIITVNSVIWNESRDDWESEMQGITCSLAIGGLSHGKERLHVEPWSGTIAPSGAWEDLRVSRLQEAKCFKFIHLRGGQILALFYRLSKFCLLSWMTESWGYTAVSGEVRICWFNKHSLGTYYVPGAFECVLQILPAFVLLTAQWIRYYCYPWFTDEGTEAQRGRKLTQDHSARKWKSQGLSPGWLDSESVFIAMCFANSFKPKSD